MLQEIYADPDRVRHLLDDPCGAHITSFVTAGIDAGFTPLTLRGHLRVLGKFNHWIRDHGVSPSSLTEQHIKEFVRGWSPQQCLGRSRCSSLLWRFLDHLRLSGVATPPKDEASRRCLTAIDRHVAQFTEFLAQERGLSRSTIARYGFLIRGCLTKHFGRHASVISLKQLHPRDVSTWVRKTAHDRAPGRARELVSALRTFFRWLQSRGLVGPALTAAVPTVATWRLRTVPSVLTPPDVKRLLRACDQRTAMGRRDYAILILLARLGLRAGEIVSLQLNDVDWRSGVLRVCRKGGRVDEVPIPPDVGKAVARYIQYGRPWCSERRVFLCTTAPHRGLGHSSTVSSIVAAALRRAGLTPARRGAHLLRHTLASSLLRRGAPLGEIGQLLGHRSRSSTEVYAKIDIVGLRTVAQHWPAEAR